MRNITNAYLVLSVANIRAMLRAAELEQKVRGESRESITIVLHNIAVSFEHGDEPQITSGSVLRAVDNLVAESNEDLDIRALVARLDEEETPFNHSDAAI